MVIRTVKQEDYDTIYHFVKTAFETAQVKDGTEQDFRAQASGREYVFAGFGVCGGRKRRINWTHYADKTGRRMRGRYDIYGVLVAPLSVALEHRNQGIGGKLMRHACDKAVGAGYTAAFLVGKPTVLRPVWLPKNDGLWNPKQLGHSG